MPSRLILRLNTDPEGLPDWLHADGGGHVLGQGTEGELAELAARAQGARVIALAPGTSVLLARASVPTQNRQKLIKALPFVLEDQLADDVDRLHFVSGRRNPDGSWPVAVVEKAWLDNWLTRLAEHDLTPERVVPETLCLPWTPSQWTVLADQHTALVRTDEQNGFAGDTRNLDALLSAALDEPDIALPEGLLLLETAEAAAPLPPELENTAVTRQNVDDVLSVLAQRADDEAAITLLSGAYTPTGGRRQLWRPWAAAGILFAVWLVLSTGQTLLDQRALRAELETVNAQITSLLQEVYPQARDHGQARSRLESRLSQLRGGGRQGDDLLDTLLLAGPVLRNSGEVRLNGLSWRTGSLELEIRTASLQDLDQLKQELDGTDGLSADVRSARTEDDVVEGRLMVRRINP
ncbi:MAG: type II secretion system protein GspL [Aquisalimonadaceae bacterium]